MNGNAASEQVPRDRVTILVVLTVAAIVAAVFLIQTDERLDQLRLLNSAYAIIGSVGLESPGSDSLLLAAADGIMSSLDPYCEYMPPSRWEIMREETEGLYHGIGVEMVIDGGVITVVSPIPGSPAERAGLRPGDRIVEIDGKTARDITSAEASDRLRGEAGTTVTIGIERVGFDIPLTFELERAEIIVEPVSFSGMTPDKIAYIRLARFSPGASTMLDSVLSRFMADGSKGWILDLRGNPGGYLDQAVEVAGCFLPRGALVCETRARRRILSFSLWNEQDPVSTEIPLVVLIDEGSASASEIVAAAIADHRRGVIVGRRSFGKGLVQSITAMDEHNFLQLTTGRYFTPGGYSFSRTWGADEPDTLAPVTGQAGVQDGGLEPDVTIDVDNISGPEIELARRGAFLSFVASVYDSLPRTSFSAIWDRFLSSIGGGNMEFLTPLEVAIAQAEKVADQSLIAAKWKKAFSGLKAPIAADHANELTRALPRLKIRLAEALVLHGNEHGAAVLPFYLSLDPDTRAALEVLGDPPRYRSVLRQPRYAREGQTAQVDESSTK